jgi:hypothetical protein
MARKRRAPTRQALLRQAVFDYFKRYGFTNVLRRMTREQKVLLTLRVVQILGRKRLLTLLSPEDCREMLRW